MHLLLMLHLLLWYYLRTSVNKCIRFYFYSCCFLCIYVLLLLLPIVFMSISIDFYMYNISICCDLLVILEPPYKNYVTMYKLYIADRTVVHNSSPVTFSVPLCVTLFLEQHNVREWARERGRVHVRFLKMIKCIVSCVRLHCTAWVLVYLNKWHYTSVSNDAHEMSDV